MHYTILVLIAVFAMLPRLSTDAAEKSSLGRTIETFQLLDFRGAAWNLEDVQDRELVVVCFLGTECPVAKFYGPRLAELAAEFEPQNVAFVAINSNRQDTLAEMAHYAKTSKIEFPFLKDPANAVADRFQAERTPEVFVLDKQRVVRYRGRIDDQMGVGFTRTEPKRRDLAIALGELLEGKAVTQAELPAAGCYIGRTPRKTPRGEITYTKHIAPLMQEHCVTCHRSGEIGPFTLTSHDDVVNWSATIREVVEQRRMPPWHAESAPGEFLNDRRLPAEQQALLFDWIDNGMPEGDPADLPAPRKFVHGWEIPTPDLVLEMPEAFTVPAQGTVEYKYFAVGESFPEDRWISAAEARPGNRAVVHHIILFFLPPGSDRHVGEASLRNSLATFAPGVPAWQARPGMAKRIPAGSKLYFQMHYTPNGTETTDLSRAGLVFTDAKSVEKQLRVDAVINTGLRIPPQADNASFHAEYRFPRDTRLVSLLPHMHLRGKAFRVETVDAQGERKLLIDVPRYDFNWQNNYVFSEPPLLREGMKLHCTAWYDNSERNPANPDPTATVGWGDQTWEEMLVAQFESVLDVEDLRRGLPKIQPLADNEFEVEFAFRPDQPAEAVYLAGKFNEWKPADLKMNGPDESGVYRKKITLQAGAHEYKFVINGTLWRADPGNPDFTGTYANSVLRIPPNESANNRSR